MVSLSDEDFLREHPYEEVPLTKEEKRVLQKKARYRRAGKLIGLGLCLSVVFVVTLAGVGFFRNSDNNEDHSTSIDDEIRAMVLGCMDQTVDPCTDFVNYACGGWDSKTPIPPDDVKASRFYQGGEMEAANNRVLQQILDSKPPYLDPFYQSCLNQAEADRLGSGPLTNYINTINSLIDEPTLINVMRIIGALHQIEVPVVFYFLVANDLLEPDTYLVQLVQAGLGLPDRDYYFTNDPNLLPTYINHVAAILALVNNGTASDWVDEATGVVNFETDLAAFSLSGQFGDYLKLNTSYHKMNQTDFMNAYPMEWQMYFAELQLSPTLPVNPVQTAYFNNLIPLLEQQLNDTSVLRWYFQWQLAHYTSNYLSSPFIIETFRFYGTYLQGQLTPLSRADQCLQEINGNWILGMELGKYFIEKAYAGSSQSMVTSIFTSVLQGFISNLATLPWLDDTTRQYAQEKALKMIEQSGYPGPTGFPDLSKLNPPLNPNTHFNNAINTFAFHFRSVVERAGTTVDPSHWDLISQMPVFPQTVTAFNAESPNIMFIPAGITQWPLFHTQFPPAMMYGGFAMIAGHELTHGFDLAGREFDADGKLFDWWTPYTAQEFENLSTCMVSQYNQYEVQPGLYIDGLMTVNENIADNGGLRESWTAYRNIVGGPNGGIKQSIVPGFTNDQLFFLQYGQMWCFKMTPEYEQQWVKTNVHAIPRFRVQGVLSNMPEFSEAFRCPVNSTYNPSTKCQVW